MPSSSASSSSQGRLPLGSDKAAAAVSKWVVFKLLAFTIAMFSVPIGTYYATLERIFDGNGTYAAGAAAAMVNVVALGYIIAASLEDKSEKPKKE
ncbi:hypothetical protein K492DRAFT_207102 [Lichtheimia hyalospora FSU 10163]|nr:hypothetical protein K492DRAFT_207102 [Lichtheimia hyalospora FSU 10163]